MARDTKRSNLGAPEFMSRRRVSCCLTAKLRGCPKAPDERRGRTLSSSACGAEPHEHHGPLERLLDAADTAAHGRLSLL
jgi:hypothetical protein